MPLALDWSGGTWADSSGWGDYFGRTRVSAASLSYSGTEVRVRVRAQATSTFTIENAWIGNYGGNLVDFDGGQKQLLFNGSPGAIVPANGRLFSDWIQFTFNKLTDKIIHVDMNTALTTVRQAADYRAYWRSGDDNGSTSVTGITASVPLTASYWIDQIEVRGQGLMTASFGG